MLSDNYVQNRKKQEVISIKNTLAEKPASKKFFENNQEIVYNTNVQKQSNLIK